jgi:hypothetical protein
VLGVDDDTAMSQAALALVVGFGAAIVGAGVGAFLTRRNERASSADRLLAEAINDLVAAIAEVTGGSGQDAMNRYASATARVALHGSPEVVEAFYEFQKDANTGTTDGRQRLMAALQVARCDLGHKRIDNEAHLRALLFGS